MTRREKRIQKSLVKRESRREKAIRCIESFGITVEQLHEYDLVRLSREHVTLRFYAFHLENKRSVNTIVDIFFKYWYKEKDKKPEPKVDSDGVPRMVVESICELYYDN